MFSLFKRKNTPEQVPAWASFFSPPQYKQFIGLVEKYFKSKNIRYTIGNGVLHIDEDDFPFPNAGLVNLAQMCYQCSESEWKETITNHFEAIGNRSEFDEDFDANVHDYCWVEKYIGVRLYNKDYIAQVNADQALTRDIGGDIMALLVFDLPNSVTSISKDQSLAWNKPVEELFQTGLENIRNNYEFNTSQEKIGECWIWFVQGDHFFVPNLVLDIERYPHLVGSKGSLIGIPHRHAVLIYPIENLEIVKAINHLIPITKGMHREGPGSVSEHLFWYKDGQFMTLPYELGEEKLRFFPPEAFLDMLNTLEERK
jgi:hypothetical protein